MRLLRPLRYLPILLATSAIASPQFSVDDAVGTAASGKISFAVRKHGHLDGGSSTVTVSTRELVGDTAQAGRDYTASNVTLTFAPLEVVKAFDVPLATGVSAAAPRKFSVKMTAGSNAKVFDAVAYGTIRYGSVSAPPAGCTNTVTVTGEFALDRLGVCNILSNFDVASMTVTGGPIPVDDGDPVGAFRFHCIAGQLAYDDPIVYPGQAGKSHLHQFYGNTGANAASTYSSLRTTGNSTCFSPINRSAYWMPAMLDGHGNVVRPDLIAVYYKRLPTTNTACHRISQNRPTAGGECEPLVNGMRFVSGYNMATHQTPEQLDPGIPPVTAFHCYRRTSPGNVEEVTAMTTTLAALVPNCPTANNADGRKNQIEVVTRSEECWDGINLDSANHRSHLAFQTYTNSPDGLPKCPSTHPYNIPVFQLGVFFTVDANLADWRLSSDEMERMLYDAATPGGRTMHFDWFGAWDNLILKRWMDNCINLGLSCVNMEFGDGTRSADTTNGALSNAIQGNTISPRLVPTPVNPITGTTMPPM
jgi:hypothetical protein